MSGTKTTQNQWVSKQGEDYLQLLGPDGALLSGIDSTGAGFGALAGDGGLKRSYNGSIFSFLLALLIFVGSERL